MALPAASTIGDILKRNGLVKARKRRRFAVPATQPFASCEAANDLWCTDFKGHFMDGHTRFLIRCTALERMETEDVRSVFEDAFREFGVPKAIRSDNGPPFAARGPAGLSRLAAWWIKLGIVPDRIESG